jgi:hypothetical protein
LGEHRNVQSEELCCSIPDIQRFAFDAELDEPVGAVDYFKGLKPKNE